MELSKLALKAIKSLNKEITKQGVTGNIQVSDETESLLMQLPKEQLCGVVTHYAYFLYLLGQMKAGKPLPFEIVEVMRMVGLRDNLDKDIDKIENGNFFERKG